MPERLPSSAGGVRLVVSAPPPRPPRPPPNPRPGPALSHQSYAPPRPFPAPAAPGVAPAPGAPRAGASVSAPASICAYTTFGFDFDTERPMRPNAPLGNPFPLMRSHDWPALSDFQSALPAPPPL